MAEPDTVFRRVWLVCSWYWLGLVPVLVGVSLGLTYFPQHSPYPKGPGFIDAFGAWDGWWYSRIVTDGYSYDPETVSSVSFFPAYPLLGRCVKELTGLSAHVSLLIVAHMSLMLVFLLLAVYTRRRFPTERRLPEYVLISFAFLPTTFFFRMTYSESLFVLFMLMAMIGMLEQWPAWTVALLVGITTACRPVGIALVPVLGWWLWTQRKSTIRFGWSAAVLLPVGCWGIAAYMAYQFVIFGDPMAFVKSQEQWATRPDLICPRKLWSLIILEPLWSVYVPSSPAHWARHEYVANPIFSLHFWNPIYFLVCVGLVVYGAWRRWLTTSEVLLASGLLLIPYVTHSYRTMFMAQGRYAASVFPMYLVMGRIAGQLRPPVLAAATAILVVKLVILSALFAAWSPGVAADSQTDGGASSSLAVVLQSCDLVYDNLAAGRAPPITSAL